MRPLAYLSGERMAGLWWADHSFRDIIQYQFLKMAIDCLYTISSWSEVELTLGWILTTSSFHSLKYLGERMTTIIWADPPIFLNWPRTSLSSLVARFKTLEVNSWLILLCVEILSSSVAPRLFFGERMTTFVWADQPIIFNTPCPGSYGLLGVWDEPVKKRDWIQRVVDFPQLQIAVSLIFVWANIMDSVSGSTNYQDITLHSFWQVL